MADNFDVAFSNLLKEEGGFVKNPNDPGGATNRGVTKQTWEEWVGHEVSVDDIKALTVEDVKPLYKKRYWDACRCDDLPGSVDLYVFDWAVNAGTRSAVKFLQEVLGVVVDGNIGPRTLAAAQSVGVNLLVNKLAARRESFYRSLKTFPIFGKGWLGRTERVRVAALSLANKG